MKREIRLSEAIGIMITIIVAVLIAYINVKIDIADHSRRIQTLEGVYEKMDGKQNSILLRQEEILIQLQNKQNRK